MSIRINIRLPDNVHTGCMAYVQEARITLTDMVIAGLRLQLSPPAIQEYNEPEIVHQDAPGAEKKPPNPPQKSIIKDVSDINVSALRAKYKAANPNAICVKCRSFNKDCNCP